MPWLGWNANDAPARHIVSVHKKKKPSKCNSCPKAFAREDNLKAHMNLSNCTSQKKEYLLACHICSKRFTKACHVRVHISSVHEKNKPFECRICQISFSEKSKLTRHMSLCMKRKGCSNVTPVHKPLEGRKKLNAHIKLTNCSSQQKTN